MEEWVTEATVSPNCRDTVAPCRTLSHLVAPCRTVTGGLRAVTGRDGAVTDRREWRKIPLALSPLED